MKNKKGIIIGVLAIAVLITTVVVINKRVLPILKNDLAKSKPDKEDFEKIIEQINSIHPDIVQRWNSYSEQRKQKAIDMVTKDWATFNRFKSGIMQPYISYQFMQEFDF